MKRALAVLVLGLLVFTLRWICPASYAQQQTSQTLTVESRPGGSIIIRSNTVNNGNPYTLGPGEKQTWSVPYRTTVTLTATDFATGLTFSHWSGPFYWPDNFANPLTTTIESNTEIAANFHVSSAPNALSVSLSLPRNMTSNQKDVPVTFEIANPAPGPHTNVKTRVTMISFYLDGEGFYGAEQPQIVSGSLNRYHYNSTLYGLAEGEHSFFVVAVAQFEVISGISYWGTPYARSPGSGVSDMVHFVVDTVAPRVSVLEPLNETYYSPEVPLNFVVDKPVSWMGYSLDGAAKVTVPANSTLFGLSEGSHTLTVYGGNVGVSETIMFTIAKPEQLPISSVGIAIISSAAMISFGIVAYFVRRNRRRIK